MDISGAYLQGTGWIRVVCIRPPSEDNSEDILWLLEKPAYGLVDIGRIWYLTSDDALRKIRTREGHQRINVIYKKGPAKK